MQCILGKTQKQRESNCVDLREIIENVDYRFFFDKWTQIPFYLKMDHIMFFCIHFVYFGTCFCVCKINTNINEWKEYFWPTKESFQPTKDHMRMVIDL